MTYKSKVSVRGREIRWGRKGEFRRHLFHYISLYNVVIIVKLLLLLLLLFWASFCSCWMGFKQFLGWRYVLVLSLAQGHSRSTLHLNFLGSVCSPPVVFFLFVCETVEALLLSTVPSVSSHTLCLEVVNRAAFEILRQFPCETNTAWEKKPIFRQA